MMAPPIIVTEDTPPDMLAGSMDLTVVLPDNHALKMSVERSTPMMDLLVQVTTANKLSPAGYIIRPLNERGTLPYKPSTPIGALDAWTIHVVPKQHAQCTSNKKSHKSLNQPFEQTFRLQVHLPRNQLYVARVSPKTRLADILLQVCSEKNLDSLKYSLRHPNNLDQVLSLSCTLADYKLQELTLVCNRTHPVEVSTVDIMSLQRETSNPAYRNNMCEGSVSSGSLEGRSLSPVPSDESASPPPIPLPPSRPTRKRRPAPKPPTINQNSTNEEKPINGIQSSTVINHSRNSSDSSGYHEASVLSESPQSNNVSESLSRRKMASVTEDPGTASLSQSLTDVTVIQPPLQQATSYSSLSSITGRKKKSAPPPPPVEKNRASVLEDQQRTPSVSSTASSTTTLDGNEVTVAVKSATLPPSSRLNSVGTCVSSSPPIPPTTSYKVPPSPPSPAYKVPPSSPLPTPARTPAVDVEPLTTRQETEISELRMADEEIDRIFTNATENHASAESDEEELVSLSKLPSPPSVRHESQIKESSQVEDTVDWEYKLPAPPTFRDDSKSPTVTEFGTITIGNLSEVLCSEKVKQDCDVDLRPINKNENRNSDSLKDCVQVKCLEKVRNVSENVEEMLIIQHRLGSRSSSDDLSSNLSAKEYEQRVIDELSSTLSRKQSKVDVNDEPRQQHQELSSNSTLDNFVITTYKDKKPVEVFEDDSIKSSAGEKRDKSKDDAVFRAPKPRVKEPNLSRTSSFSLENKLNGPMIKRSVSYVSLLAANMPRNSQPYRAHLSASRGELRKTTSELNIDNSARDSSFWQSSNDQSELQSVQVLRNILSRSHANVSCTFDEQTSGTDSQLQKQNRDPHMSEQRFEEPSEVQFSGSRKWSRSHSEDDDTVSSTTKWTDTKIHHSNSLDQEHSKSFNRGQPSINLSTWSERPKRQVSIKDDGDYTFGIGRKSIIQDDVSNAGKVTKTSTLSKVYPKENSSWDIPVTNQESFKLENRSKSISDLSRIPIVRAVELKKPFAAHNFEPITLKSVEKLGNTGPSSKSDKINQAELNNNDNGFIGVNSLARKFGASQKKRPVSLYGTSFEQNNFHSEFKDIIGVTDTNIGNKFDSCNKADQNKFSTVNKNIEMRNEAQVKLDELRKRPDPTAEIKALAKIRSGGFVEDVPDFSPLSQVSLKPVDKTVKRLSTKNEENVYKNNFSSRPKQSSTVSLNGSETLVTSSISLISKPPPTSAFQSTQITRSKERPVNLQPVVKGFRVSIDTSSSLVKGSAAPSSFKSNNFACSRSNSITENDSRTTYHRAFSTPNMINHDSAKENNKDASSVPSFRASKLIKSNSQTDYVIPPPPPLMPVLKPADERKGVRFLPAPAANPRDQLMSSIRSFSKDHLKSVSK